MIEVISDIQIQKDFLLTIWASVKAGTRIFLYAFKLKPSLILSPTVFGAQPSSLDFFLTDFLILLWDTFLWILAINDFVRIVHGRSCEILDDIPFLVKRITRI